MASHRVGSYPQFENYEFDRLPKGEMFAIAMNPYTGALFLCTEKHESSTVIALDVIREIVHACELLERLDCSDPLRDYIKYSESEELVEKLLEAARTEIRRIPGGKREKPQVIGKYGVRKTA